MDGSVRTASDDGLQSYNRGNESSLVSALKTLLFFTIMMVTLPIGLYFATKAYLFEGSMKISGVVYVAWNEGTTPKGKGKHD
ncbi:hypothetical protein KUCAC02_003952 [Chaenocephalus aceratus]|uniref:Uncharacterized protein n=1 Tax=Chaenocephalus aceratus TaxID=36190 RepID=A0ACB9WYM5_CHAAC|nr:hypothetical protein KUCAC02_003952 [Chaenocephalus aceratus]